MKHKKVLNIFLDGIGIGENSKDTNPMTELKGGFFPCGLKLHETAALPYKGIVKAVDSLLDVEGIPQSATGQSSLFTGHNAARLIGSHLTAFPNKRLRALIYSQNVLKNIKQLGKKSVFINCYPTITDQLRAGCYVKLDSRGNIISNLPKRFLQMISVTTTMLLSAHQFFFDMEDLAKGNCIYHDFTNQVLQQNYPDVPLFSPYQAGKTLARAAENYNYTLYEYFRTDQVGHRAQREQSLSILQDLEKFLQGVLENINLNDFIVIICSDHGNMEDLNSGIHTKNPVPFMFWGKNTDRLLENCLSLPDLYKSIMTIFQSD